MRTAFKNISPYELSGRVIECVGSRLKVKIPGAGTGDEVEILSERGVKKGVVTGFSDQDTSVTTLDEPSGIRPGTEVLLFQSPLSITIPDDALGLAISSTGDVLDGRRPEKTTNVSPNLKRNTLKDRSTKLAQFKTGCGSLDALMPLAVGQRILVAAEPGVGKTHFLSALAANSDADVIVFCLVGERGREAKEFISETLSPDLRSKAVLVVSTSEEPPLRRVLSAQLGTSIAEHYAGRGKKVLLLVDSLTRYLRAKRDVQLSSGEPPIRRGYPASVFSDLPTLLERPGNFRRGSITAFYTMLIDSSIDEDPMLEEVRGILDGHIILRRKLAEKGIYPAISFSESLSRLAGRLQTEAERNDSALLRRIISRLETDRDLALISDNLDAELELALKHEAEIEKFISSPISADCLSRLAGTFREKMNSP